MPEDAAQPIAGYELIRKLGEGGMGATYLARQVSFDRLVAIKVLRRSMAQDTAFVERFVREARLGGRLDHVNIVRALDVGESGGFHYLAMDYVEGRTALELMPPDGAMEEARALDIALQVARALDYAAGHGIVHRDVKPDNVLVQPDGTAKLCDFGLARQLDSELRLTQSGITVGTVNYMAPEQARGERNADGRADVYSLGATLYHLVTGRTPFQGEEVMAVMNALLTETPPWPSELNPGVSQHCCQLIAKAMARDAADRYQTAADMIEDLELVIGGNAPLKAVLEPPPGAEPPPQPPEPPEPPPPAPAPARRVSSRLGAAATRKTVRLSAVKPRRRNWKLGLAILVAVVSMLLGWMLQSMMNRDSDDTGDRGSNSLPAPELSSPEPEGPTNGDDGASEPRLPAPVAGGRPTAYVATWKLMEPKGLLADGSPGELPRQRSAPGAAYDSKRGRCIMYGDSVAPHYNDLWAYDAGANTWTCLQADDPKANGATRPTRINWEGCSVGPPFAYDPISDSYWLVHGNREGSLWRFSPAEGRWEKAFDTKQRFVALGWSPNVKKLVGWLSDAGKMGSGCIVNPTTRSVQAGARHALGGLVTCGNTFCVPGGFSPDAGGRFLLFGGTDWARMFDDTRLYSFDGDSWTEPKPARSPEARMSMRLIYDSRLAVWVIFGGQARRSDSGPKNRRERLGDMWAYDPKIDAWIEVRASSGPQGLSGLSMTSGLAAFWYDQRRDLGVLLTSERQPQTWTLKIEPGPAR